MGDSTLRDLLIVGVGPHAAEITEIVARVNAHHPMWNLLGFLSHHGEHVGESPNGLPIRGSAQALADYPHAFLVPKHEWPDEPALPRERLISLLGPSAFIAPSAEIGAGVVIYPNCFVGANVRIADRVFCLSASVINHDDVIGERAVIASGVTLAG
jgi:hypothetical protein